jgi:hypothetical protein
MDKQEYIDSLVAQGLSDDDILKKVNEKFGGSSPDFQTPTAPDAVVEETVASNTDSSSDPGSLDLQIDPNKFKVFDPKSITSKPTGLGIKEVPIVDNNKTQFNINKISTNLKKKEVEENINNRSSYRSGVRAIVNSNTLYQLDLDGDSIEKLNESGKLDIKVRELAKESFYANTKNIGKDLPSGYTDIVNEEIQKAIKKEKEEEAKIDDDQYKSLEDNNLVYTTVNKSIANNFYNDLRPNQKVYVNLKNEIAKYENIISTSDNFDIIEEAKLKLTSLKKKEPEAFKAMEKRFDAEPLFDANGERITKSEFEEVGGNDKSEAYKTIKEGYNTMDKDSLQKQFALWTLDKNDNNRKLNQTVDLKPSNTQLNLWLYNAGYKPNSEGVYSDVKYSDIVGYRGEGLEMHRGDDFKGEQVYTDLPAELKDLYEERVDLSLKQQALKETFVLNQDPGSMKTGIAGGISTFGKESLVSLVRMFSPEKAEDLKKQLPQTRREELDELQKLLGNSGIRLSKEQEATFERDWAMNLTEGLGGFTGDLLQFALLNKVAGAAGITARIAQIGRTNPAQAKMYTLLMEEIKFEAVTRGEAATGEGVFFGAGGMVAAKFIPKLTGNLARYNNIIEKSIGGGAGMAAGSETAAAMHAITDHYLQKKEFKNSIDELYGDLSEAGQRIMGNILMGKALGMAKLNLRDFKSISEVRKIYDKTNSDLFAGKFKGIELEKKKKLLAELDRTLNQADKGFNELDLGSQQGEVAKANAVIKKYNDRRYGEGNKPDQSVFKSAKKIVNNYEANKAIAIHKIKRQEIRLRESEAFQGNFNGIEIKENNKSFESQDNKAQYNPNTKKIQIDISQYKPGVLGQEVGHVMMGAAFANNPALAGRFKNKIKDLVENKLQGDFLNSKGEKINFEEAIKEAYPKKSQRPEEYVMNVVEFLSQPKYKELLLKDGVLNEFKRSTLNYANKVGLDYTNKKNFTEGKDLMEFLFSIGKVAEGGSTKAIKNKFKAFENIVIDGKKLLDINTGKEISVKDITASKDFSKEITPELQGGEKKSVLQAIKDLVPKNIKTKADYDAWATGKGQRILGDAFSPAGQSNISFPKKGGPIFNYIRSGKTRAESDKTLMDVLERTMKFDPEATRKDGTKVGVEGFGERVFADSAWARLTSREALFKEGEKLKQERSIEDSDFQIADNVVRTKIEPTTKGGTPSIIQSNLKVNSKRVFERKEIVEEVEGKKIKRIQRNEIANNFIKEADLVLQKVADLGFKPADKGFRKALAKEITTNNPELFEKFKKSLGNYDNFINENYATLLINKKALPLEFFVQAEKFRANENENIFVKKSPDPRYKNGRATKQKLIREAIREGKASYTENEAQGVNVYDRLTPPKAKGISFFKIPNVKKRLLESLYKASVVDAIVNQSRSKKIYSTAEIKEISVKLQKESDLYFSKAITSADKAKQIVKESIISKGYGVKGRYKNAEEQVKDYKALIDYAESIKDPLILNLLERANVTPTSYDFRRSKDFWVGNGVKNTELRKELYDAGIIVDIATIHDYATSKFNIKKLTEKQSEATTFGKSVQNINTTKKGTGVEQGKKLVAKNAKNETLRKNAILEYSKSVIKLMKFNPRATFSLIYNQSARGGQNRQLSKVMAWENGIKVGIKGKRDVHLEHLLQNGEFNLVLIDAAKSNSKSGVEQVLKWISENYKQYAVKTTTADLVDQTVSLKDGTKWKAKSELHPDIKTAIKKVLNGEKNIKIPDADLRLFNGVIKANPNIINLAKGTLAKKWNVEVAKRFHNVRNVFEKQGDLIFKQIKGEITAAQAKKEIDLFINKIAPSNIKAALKISKGKIKDINEAIEKLKETDKVNVKKQKEVFASKDLNAEFNKFLETSTGIGAEKVFSESKATVRGKKVKKSFGDYFIPVGAEDFAGLMHKTLAKGKKGEQQLEFYKKNLYEPFNVANENITRERTALMNDFRALKQNLTSVPKDLNKMTKGGDFTIEQALRVAIWNKQGMEIPGLSKTDKASLLKEVNSNPELSNFVTELLKTTKGDGYAKPENNWELGTIVTDLISLLNGTKRSKHLEVWSNNVEQIFSKENRYKLEAAYGRDYVQTLGKTLERMKNGSNRKWGGNPTVEKWLDWVNGSVGAIMFLNTRSAALQTISSINYLNFSDNNPLAAAKAFANQPQFWKDFKELYNSDYLKDRRGGNKINVNESELALAAEKGGIQGVISLMLNKGFVLTKGADSFAIASGGSAMYRNRINKYQKEGLSEKEAKEKAFLDFKAITEETQQSSRADRISEQQASNAGRLLLAFANTPMQYNRLIKRNAQDLLAGRGNKAEKMTRITYYSTIQNFIFNALQKALFAVGFGDDDEETVKRYSSIGNGMVDSLLRGSGLTGNAALAIKNVAVDVADRFDRPRPNFQDAAWKALTVSPPIYSKVSKLRSAGYSLGYTTKDNIFKPSLDNPALSAGAQITSATLNLPLDRVLRKAQNIEAAMSDEAEWWQRSALLMGWGKWELGMQEPRGKAKKKKSNQFSTTTYSRNSSNRSSLKYKRK